MWSGRGGEGRCSCSCPHVACASPSPPDVEWKRVREKTEPITDPSPTLVQLVGGKGALYTNLTELVGNKKIN